MKGVADAPMCILVRCEACRRRTTVGRHATPLAGAVVLLGVFMGASLWAVPHLRHSSGWLYFGDIWNYFQLAHFTDLGIYQVIYGQTLTTTPGIILVLAPAWAITHAAGNLGRVPVRGTAPNGVAGAWPLRSTPQCISLVRCGRRCRAPWSHEGAAAADLRWWCPRALQRGLVGTSPEDAVAVAFLLYSCLAASDRRWATSAWLFGAAVAFQPFVLLTLAPVFFPAGLRRVPV